MKAFFDTNILVDYLIGIEAAKHELQRYEHLFISIITWMEVMVGVDDPEEEKTIRTFLNHFSVQYINRNIAELAVQIRRKEKVRLPDAIIWATARESGYILVTRNTRDFDPEHPGIRVPYTI
jgi:hypothetical protein